MFVIWNLYKAAVFDRPRAVIVLLTILTVLFAWQARNFQLDASAESLVLENDPDLKLYREVSDRYGSQDFLVLTYTPNSALFSDESLASLQALRDEIRQVEGVESVLSVLDVPLLQNPPVPLTELVGNIKTLEDPEADKSLGRQELSNSPLYVNLLLNLEENTTALQINFPVDEVYQRLLETRAPLLDAKMERALTSTERQNLQTLNELVRAQIAINAEKHHQIIEQVRAIMDGYDEQAELHLGGVPMLADDIMTFVRKDLVNFGMGILVFLVITLLLIFRHLRWVLLPLVSCSMVVVWMLGILGLFAWPVTVISSNFISLLLILTLSMLIHQIVRYRELLRRRPSDTQEALVADTVKTIWLPCFYMALTTAVAFISLAFSGIRPVINFGWMMTLGIVVAYLIAFTLFPAVLLILGKNAKVAERSKGAPLTGWLARISTRYGGSVILVAVFMTGFTIIGVNKLIVENSFIDYFNEKTEIYRGMSVIDERLGGTTPLEVIISFPEADKPVVVVQSPEQTVDDEFGDAFADDPFADDPFGDDPVGADPFATGEEEDESKYWFTQDKINVIKAVHDYLDAQPETGKVLSLATMMEIAEDFNDGEPLSNLQLALLYSLIPDEFKELVVDPYVNVEASEARISVRILDSSPDLKRDEFLKRMQQALPEAAGINAERVQLSGMMVLYNNMLQSLYQSQISTLSAVMFGIFVMFIVLFRSWKIAVIGMVPNAIAALFVLGVMGWAGIPLDMMTITIASITIGIAVDNTIHYIVRFKREFAKIGDYHETLLRCHDTIGKAMFYTSLTIIAGFSILMLSNFKPTIYFGLLTSIAMLIALVGALTLLPRLIVLVKPFK
ncbi:efflux RND transporter permease subunit [Salinibius halmophilus]|uniref:efflux RND transporter permease subunit n=1 Tax=Salinibius halmophilus TaxID=1853216 RepID=UPI000E671921|nr:efflux RND transporter permease subunit [Salinibius halmophilus]